MKGLLLLALVAGVTGRSEFFWSDTQEVDSSEHGGPPGSRWTTCPCGWANKASKRVVGGKETAVNEFPFLVVLVDGATLQPFCGGTILTANHVLTAAHCTINYVQNGGSIIVSIGDHNLTTLDEAPDNQVVKVSNIMQHELYDHSRFFNDVSVLFLEQPIKFSQRVGPACISHTQMNLEQKTVKVIGWGKTSHEAEAMSTTLQHVNLRVIPHMLCMQKYPNNIPLGLQKFHICAHSKDKGACNGDSGGPLVWLDPETNRYTLVGVVSFGRICGTDPSAFADAGAYMMWIQMKIKMSNPWAQTCSKI